MQKLYIVMGLTIISLSLHGMDFSRQKQTNSQNQETMIRDYLNKKAEKEIEAAQQEFMIRKFLDVEVKKEKETLLKNQNSSHYVFCITI
jgi:hypothetical protein